MATPIPSLTRRIAVAMTIFGCVVAFMFTATTIVTLLQTEDEVLFRFVETEAKHLLAERATLGESVPSSSRYTICSERDESCDLHKRYASRAPGSFEADIHDREFVVLIRETPEEGRVYLSFDSEGIEPHDTTFGRIVLALAIGIGALMALATLIVGRRLAQRVVRPVQELVEVVESDSPQALSERLRAQSCDREIQTLVSSLADNVETIEAYRQRERNFTRYASHELRSPIAVIQGASELLRADPEQRPVLLDRIDRGVDSMRSLIDTFLWLARAPDLEPDAPVSIAEAIDRVVTGQSEIARRVGVEIVRVVDEEARVPAPSAALEIAISNLLTNAISFAARKPVTIQADAGGVTVKDQGRGMSESQTVRSMNQFVRAGDSDGYGLGLPIVDAICDRLGWTLSMSSELGQGTTARIEFKAMS